MINVIELELYEPLLDEKVLKKLVKDTDIETVEIAIDSYLKESMTRLERIYLAFNNNNLETLEVELHTLGNIALTFGNTQLARIVMDTENYLRIENNLEVQKRLRALPSVSQQSFNTLILLRLNYFTKRIIMDR
ncbi:Hpt domain-containing protein [Vibrio natriegens]|uniref:Hpt domain-containing protein n=1 Tax=Vibrio natriegens TaxID=691 RepID=UPI0021E99FA5|nr:Hpt domain-containing protein [Vibrio natriegens]UYI46368.1 Hpt domain-containing protein [Vibrio natriegens]